MILKKMRKVIALIICAFLILISVTCSMAFAGSSGNGSDGSDPPISVKTYNQVYEKAGEYFFSMDTDFVVVKQPYKHCYVWTKTKLSEANQERIEAEIKERDDQTIVPEGHFTFHFGYNNNFKISEDTKSKSFILRVNWPNIRLSILDSCHRPEGYGIPAANGTFGTPPAKEVKAQIHLFKVLNGKEPEKNQFEFNLKQVDENGDDMDKPYKQVAYNDENGDIIFKDIFYNVSNGNQSRDYYYQVTESNTDGDGMTYDKTIKHIKVSLTKNKNTNRWNVDVDYNDDRTFHNTYINPGGSTGTANIILTKILKNKTLQADMFTFELVQIDNAVNVGELGEKTFVKNDIEGNVNFKPIHYNKEDAGKTFLYKITEDYTKPISNIRYDKEYRLVEVKVANEPVNGVYETKTSFVKGKPIIENVYIDPTIPVDPTGTIKITKDIKILRGNKTINQDFYVTLFNDEQFETKFKVNPTEKLSIVNSQSTAVYYANLPKGIYYIAETDKDGNVITKENIGAQSIAYSTQKVEIKENHLSDSIIITNSFIGDSPIIIPQYGSITVVKDLLKDGKPFATDKVFYTALFSEKELKNRVSEIKAIEMKNQSTAKVIFTYAKSGSLINIGETYYVAETDKLGNPITDPKSIGIDQIKMDNNIANISYLSANPQIRITNIIVTDEPVDPTKPVDPSEPEKPADPTDTIDNDNIVQTSDDNPIVMWGMTFVVALLALLGVNVRKLKKNMR